MQTFLQHHRDLNHARLVPEAQVVPEAQHPLDLVYYDVSWELTQWKVVPPEAILQTSNPTGSPVICHSARNEIWCFIPDNQY